MTSARTQRTRLRALTIIDQHGAAFIGKRTDAERAIVRAADVREYLDRGVLVMNSLPGADAIVRRPDGQIDDDPDAQRSIKVYVRDNVGGDGVELALQAPVTLLAVTNGTVRVRVRLGREASQALENSIRVRLTRQELT